jgi:ferredoxin
MTIIDEFMDCLEGWDMVRPYIPLMMNEQDMALIVGMEGRAMTAMDVAALLEIPEDQAADLLARCYARCIVDKVVEDGVTTYTPADFHARLDHFAKFENWDDIPEKDRQAIEQHSLETFIARHQPSVERKMAGLSAENALPNDTVLLLGEVEEMIDAATDIIVQPCDCRRLAQNCDRPVETCLWFDEGAREALDRGYGRRLTTQEAKELVRWADRAGLMHTGDSAWRTRDLHAICNCCACDCYPFRAAQALNSKGVWPKSRHVATYDQDQCIDCGTCVERCHFGAFYHTCSKASEKNIQFDPDKCWGCGLCANTCPTEAILMQPINTTTRRIISIVRGKKPGFSEKPGFSSSKPQVIEKLPYMRLPYKERFAT